VLKHIGRKREWKTRKEKKTLKQCNIKTVKSDSRSSAQGLPSVLSSEHIEQATEKSSDPFTLSNTCSSLDKRGSLSDANTRNCESISTVSKASYTSSDMKYFEQNGENYPLYLNYKKIWTFIWTSCAKSVHF